MTDVVSMLCHRQGSVNVNPEAFDMAFERNIMTAYLKWLSCDTLILLWDPTTRASVLSLFSFVYCQSSNSQQNQHTARCRESVNESQMELMICEVECRQQIVMIALSLRNDVRQWLCIQSKEYWAKDITLRNPIMKLLLWRDSTIDADKTGIYQTNTIKTIQKPCQICQTCHASV